MIWEHLYASKKDASAAMARAVRADTKAAEANKRIDDMLNQPATPAEQMAVEAYDPGDLTVEFDNARV